MRERPFFIIGCPRSGTTVVRVILDGHSRLSIPPESHFVVGLGGRLRGTVTVDDILAHPEVRGWAMDEVRVRGEIERRRPADYAELVRAVFESYAAAHGKPPWGDKTPGYVSHTRRLLRLFSDAQLVHVIRDGRDVAASLREQAWGPRRAAVGAYWWRRKVAAGRRAGSRLGPDQYLELRLEDLIAHPEAQTRRLCAFLGESFEAPMLDFPSRATEMFDADDAVTHHVRKPLTAGLRDWRDGLGPREQRAVEALCHRQLGRLTYRGSTWSAPAAVLGWSLVAGHAIRAAPSSLRARLNPGRRRF